MRAIYKIARLELSNLFYSPVAWLLIVILVFMMGSMFTKFSKGLPNTRNLTGMPCFMPCRNRSFMEMKYLENGEINVIFYHAFVDDGND